MKVLQSHFFRAIIAVVVGILLIKYREQTVTWITIAIGVLFFLSGVISMAVYYSTCKHATDTIIYDTEGHQITGQKPNFPIVGLGSLILGIILALMPRNFVAGLTYIFAAILILGAINQFVNLATATKFAHVGFFFWVMPSIILLVGLIAFFRPSTIASAPLFVIGWCMLLYGVVECIDAFKLMACRKAATKSAQTYHPQTDSKEQSSSDKETPTGK